MIILIINEYNSRIYLVIMICMYIIYIYAHTHTHTLFFFDRRMYAAPGKDINLYLATINNLILGAQWSRIKSRQTVEP